MHELCKTCPYSELFWSLFSGIRTEYGDIRNISTYSARMWENAGQYNSKQRHFLRSVKLLYKIKIAAYGKKAYLGICQTSTIELLAFHYFCKKIHYRFLWSAIWLPLGHWPGDRLTQLILITTHHQFWFEGY